jgi:ABC-type antimicrobial peptide transport system permease subunit
MHVLIAVQAAFGCFVLFVAGLFVTTLNRLSHQPTGFSPERLLTLDTVAQPAEGPALWDKVAERLRRAPGVETVALADWPLLSENVRGGYITVGGGHPFADPAFFLKISPGWLAAMKIPLIAGRDFRDDDVFPKVAIVNETFAKQFLNSFVGSAGNDRDIGHNSRGAGDLPPCLASRADDLCAKDPVGTTFATSLEDKQIRLRIIGVVRAARYADLRGSMPPIAYFPFRYVDAKGALLPRGSGTFIVRTFSPDPLALASFLRRDVSSAGSEFRVRNIRTQEEIDASHTIIERLVAMLGLFFAVVGLLLAGIGQYGVLDYSVFQRRREFGIRMVIGAGSGHILRQVTLSVFSMVFAGAVLGLGLGMISTRYIGTLLYQVKTTEWSVITFPFLTIAAAALIAAVPALIRALRIDPATVLRAE